MSDRIQIPTREEADPAYQWHTQDIFEKDEGFLSALDRLKEMGKEFAAFRGKLHDSKMLLAYLELTEQVEELAGNVGSYAALKSDQDTANARYQGYMGQVSAIGVELSAATAFATPELLSLGDELVLMLDREPALAPYRKALMDVLRQKEHVLPEREERLLSLSGEMAGSAGEIFSMLNDADMSFGAVTDEKGREIPLTHGRYLHFMESADRRVRKEAFEKLYAVYREHRNTLAALLNAHERKNKFYKQARGYESCLEMCLFGNQIPKEVYHSLIQAVHGAFPAFYSYMELRKKALGVDALHMYDLYVPVVENPYGEISYEQAFELVKEALAPLGEEYAGLLCRAKDEGWIDVYENTGKRSGAYSNGTPTCHPFVLLNFQNNLESAFTLAHELGHAMHSYFSNREQRPIYRNYSIFVAEVASTVNEALLLRHLERRAQGDAKKLAYLANSALEQFRATLFRQTMFAEFELKTHEIVEQGGSLTPDLLDELYRNLCADYFGSGVVIDEQISREWSRIPHFYYDFYVYQYATGFAAAQMLSERILKGGAPEYLRFLSRGDSVPPLDALREAGADLATEKPVADALALFAGKVRELEGLL